MGENSTVSCTTSSFRANLIDFWKQYRDDIKIHVCAIVIALIGLMVLNVIWWLFAIFGVKFPSPLDYASGLQVVVDVICAVVIAVSTLRLEKRWREFDKRSDDKEKGDHIKELISDRIRELNSIELKAFCYAISDMDLVNDFLPCLDTKQLPFFAVSIVSLESHKDLVPAHFTIEAYDEVKMCIDSDEYEVEHALYNGSLLFWPKDEGDMMLNAIYRFLSSALYVRKRKSLEKIEIKISAKMVDSSISLEDDDGFRFHYKIALTLYPIDSFEDGGKFACKVIRTAII